MQFTLVQLNVTLAMRSSIATCQHDLRAGRYVS